MSEVELHAPFVGYSGAIGKIVYRNYKGRTIACLKPSPKRALSQAETNNRERFTQAASYGKLVMANPDIRAIYAEVASQKDVPVFSVCVADFLNPPSIELMDFSNYNGQVDSSIQILTADDFGVVSVNVTLRNGQGNLIESGNAVEYPVGTGQWSYMAQSNVASGTSVTAYVTATDRPGGMATQNAVTTIG